MPSNKVRNRSLAPAAPESGYTAGRSPVWIKLLSVFGFGMIGLWEGIPAGFALRLHPLTVGVVAGAGSILATLLVTALGDRLRARLLRRRPPIEGRPAKERLIDRIWRRYGIIGLGLLSPVVTGGPLGVALGLVLRAPVSRLLPWTIAGIVLWSAVLTVAGFLGVAGVGRLLAR